MKTASAFKSKYSNFRQIFSQLVCLILAVVFFTFTTSSIFAQPKNQVQKSDPFTLTPEKQGMFQGLPEKFKGLFNSDSQLLNGFFQFIERNLGGASAQQTPPTIPTYPPYQFPMPVSADFIKVTSSRRADCTQDVPPDELLPATCDDTADSQCPWTATQPPPCPLQPGEGCCTLDNGEGGLVELCIRNETLYVSNVGVCCTLIHLNNNEGLCPTNWNIAPGQSVNLCNGYYTTGATYCFTGQFDSHCDSDGGNVSCCVTAR